MESKPNDIMEKFKGLALGEKIILIAGLVLLIDSFLPWYSVDLGPFGSVNRSGWQSPGALWSILALLIALAMTASVGIKSLSPGTLPDNVSGQSWPRIYLGGGIAAALAIVIKLINENSYMGFGFYVGIVCVVALVVAGVLMYREEMSGGGTSGGVSGSTKM